LQLQAPTEEQDDEELASTRLSLELGIVGIQSSPCSSSSSGAGQQPPTHAAAAAASSSAAVPGYGPNRPRNVLTEVKSLALSSSATENRTGVALIRRPTEPLQAEKEAKRLRRVLANRESARQTILRRQVIAELNKKESSFRSLS
jgi:hypothetical protein